MVISQGEIWWADLGDPMGSAPGFRRPVLVLQCDAFNRSRISTIACVVLTSNLRLASAPGNVRLSPKHSGLEKESVVNVSSMVTLDKNQLTERIGKLAKKQLQLVFIGVDLLFGR
jgi:mRNA interferase MazF